MYGYRERIYVDIQGEAKVVAGGTLHIRVGFEYNNQGFCASSLHVATAPAFLRIVSC